MLEFLSAERDSNFTTAKSQINISKKRYCNKLPCEYVDDLLFTYETISDLADVLHGICH